MKSDLQKIIMHRKLLLKVISKMQTWPIVCSSKVGNQ